MKWVQGLQRVYNITVDYLGKKKQKEKEMNCRKT